MVQPIQKERGKVFTVPRKPGFCSGDDGGGGSDDARAFASSFAGAVDAAAMGARS
jgi:hypothetical protein